MPANERDLEPCSERATRGYPALFCELDPSNRSKPVQLFLLQKARAKLARRPVQSERPGLPAGAFAFCGVRTRFATRGCVRGGLLGWASGEVRPSVWPTVARVLADCLSSHRETLRPEKSLVHDSRGRNARTHRQPRRVGRNLDGAEGAERGSLG